MATTEARTALDAVRDHDTEHQARLPTSGMLARTIQPPSSPTPCQSCPPTDSTRSAIPRRPNPGAAGPEGTPALVMLPNDRIDPLFRATIDATEEAVVNAMLAATTMTGADGIRAFGLPGDRVVAALRKYDRMK